MNKMNIKSGLVTILFIAVASVPLMAQRNEKPSKIVKVLRAISPQYPFFAMFTNIEGLVAVSVQINSQGMVTSVLGEGQEDLVVAAEAAAKQWKFEKSQKRKSRNARLIFRFIIPNETDKSDGPKTGSTFFPPYTVEIEGRVLCLNQHKSVD